MGNASSNALRDALRYLSFLEPPGASPYRWKPPRARDGRARHSRAAPIPKGV